MLGYVIFTEEFPETNAPRKNRVKLEEPALLSRVITQKSSSSANEVMDKPVSLTP